MKNLEALQESPSHTQVVCLYGGTASGKTYSALLWCVALAIAATSERRPFRACVCRRTYPELRIACWDVALRICDDLDLVSKGVVDIRKSPTPQLLFGKNVAIEFRHADRPEEIKGAEYDVWLLDEVTDISRDFYRETLIRVPRGETTRYLSHSRHILTWNPTSRGSWVYEEFFGTTAPPDSVQLVKSTYLDNPHVSPQLVAQLQEWRRNDPRRWQVYGLGDWGSPDEVIYTKWRILHDDEIPETGTPYDAVGIDWGYANPTAVVGIIDIGENRIVVDEMLYRAGMAISELCAWARSSPQLRGVLVFCDPSDPRSIEEMRRYGIPAMPAQAKPVSAGISWLQGKEILITPRSVGLRREIAGYCWNRNAGGQLTDEPVKVLDHACDAMRYAAYTWHATGMDAKTKRARIFAG